jgi:hypothetical protein
MEGNHVPFEIKIGNMILPYQGFEIKGKFENQDLTQ